MPLISREQKLITRKRKRRRGFLSAIIMNLPTQNLAKKLLSFSFFGKEKNSHNPLEPHNFNESNKLISGTLTIFRILENNKYPLPNRRTTYNSAILKTNLFTWKVTWEGCRFFQKKTIVYNNSRRLGLILSFTVSMHST